MKVSMNVPFLNQCGRCSAWRLSKRVDLTKFQRVYLCKLCISGRGPILEPARLKGVKETKAQRQWRREQVDLDLAELHDARIHAKPMTGSNLSVLNRALLALGLPGGVRVRSLRPGHEGQIINGIMNPVEEAA
jgi:hypothetical protein